MQELGFELQEFDFNSKAKNKHKDAVDLVRKKYPSTDWFRGQSICSWLKCCQARKRIALVALVFLISCAWGYFMDKWQQNPHPKRSRHNRRRRPLCATLCSPPFKRIAHPNEAIGAAAKILLP